MPTAPPSWLSSRMTSRHQSVLSALHPLLVRLLDLSLPQEPFFYLFSGFRTLEEQAELHRLNRGSPPGKSWHNLTPSLAVDLLPLFPGEPLSWGNLKTVSALSALADSSKGLLTWGPRIRRNDIYHFQVANLPSSPPSGLLSGYTVKPSELPQTPEEAKDFLLSLSLQAKDPQ